MGVDIFNLTLPRASCLNANCWMTTLALGTSLRITLADQDRGLTSSPSFLLGRRGGPFAP